MIRQFWRTIYRLATWTVPSKLSRTGLYFIFGFILAGFALLNDVPVKTIPTEAIGLLAAGAVVVAVRTERLTRSEKIGWIIVAFFLFGIEMHILFRDHAEQEAAFAAARADELFSFKRALIDSQQKFDATMKESGKIARGLVEATKTVTGGDSVCYLDFEPALNNVAVMVVVRIGKYPLRGVNARIFDQAKWQAALTAYINSRKPQQPDMEEFSKMEEQGIGESRQPIRDFATPTRVIGGYQMAENATQSFQIVFGSFNAEWIERLEMRLVNGKWIN